MARCDNLESSQAGPQLSSLVGQADLFKAVITQRADLEAIHFLAHGLVDYRVCNRCPWHVTLEDDLRLLIHGRTLRMIHAVARAHHLLVKLLAAITSIVVGFSRSTCQQNAQEVIGAGVVACPADERGIVLTLADALEAEEKAGWEVAEAAYDGTDFVVTFEREDAR